MVQAIALTNPWNQSTFPQDLPEIDSSMQILGDYLKLGLNSRIANIYPDVVAVRRATCYNSIPADLSSFPLLKVYRTTDKFNISENETQVTAGYCLSFPDEDRIPGILRWIAVQMNSLLRKWALDHDGCQPHIDPDSDFRAEYRTMSVGGEPVYSFLLFNFSIKEDNIYGC